MEPCWTCRARLCPPLLRRRQPSEAKGHAGASLSRSRCSAEWQVSAARRQARLRKPREKPGLRASPSDLLENTTGESETSERCDAGLQLAEHQLRSQGQEGG